MKRITFLVLLALASCGKKPPGQAAYGPHCGICHHSGSGMPGEVPPLVGRLDIIAQTPEGRHYLADVLLNGLEGHFRTQGYDYNFSMSPFRSQLTDQQISDILNWLISRGNTKPAPTISPADIAAARAQSGDPSATYRERMKVNAQHPFP
ncbi:c-type cytochrome [Gluconobacter wancherniae]|uniref:Cytochrome c domain-containing protein n=1 Tax=Gluconobacter wancherniae NBRC 103581 TaxID=656744 RepID=A0A511B1P7_9PROT|nr:cytochrome c [Gluconobacter wancherniae]MBF0853840.1 c-type cytochrome [Gluconobacter wancherniae]MBS1062226.1 c-type cytochrome [Gluconobacter wancherniae]MBS1089865.1 c-type cytochrome [Gluconobacter wancherniae]MBS1094268.1 c-type cytochrome [Gluconobacter wancherniae]MBS1094643.1 c-type cytochrome [Gluconobacter wancherniae]